MAYHVMTTEQCIYHINQGKAFFQAEQYEQALQAFNTAIALVDLFPQVYVDRAATLQLLDQDEEALVDLNIAIALFEPDHIMLAAARHNRAMINESQSNLVEAFADLKRAQQLGATQVITALQKLRKRHGSIEADVSSNEQKALSLCEQGRTAVMSQQTLKGLGLFHYASELHPTLPNAFHGMGVANVSLQRFEAAIEAFTQTIQLSKSCPGMVAESLFNRSSLLLHQGDRAAGIADLKRCLQMCQDRTVSFPAFGDPDKELAFTQGLERKLDKLLQAS